jgi:predicted GH43/DUF377 family glycosyl hydrolase
MIKRSNIKLSPDPERVLLQFFAPGNDKRASDLVYRIMNLKDNKVEDILNKIMQRFSNRHRNFDSTLLNHYKKVEYLLYSAGSISISRRMLIGSYFSKEYSIESAALFNPSIVLHPDQSLLNNKDIRFIMSLRSTGEGHISSIEFRSGIISSQTIIKLDETSRFISPPSIIESERGNADDYNISFSGNESISERVIFPYSKNEKMGMEDVRFVQFIDNDNTRTYYGTFTGYDGKFITSKILETNDFISFRIRSLRGESVKDKGMALFPKKLNGKFTLISRIDGENLYFMQSDDIYSWSNARIFRGPLESWEFVQIGNCGSPIETDKGWILITHGVGAMRRYVISALLLDKEDPFKIIAYLDKPLIEPEENEREGYVPNVVYSCGGLIHDNNLIIPYAMSDSASGIATVNLNDLFNNFIPC